MEGFKLRVKVPIRYNKPEIKISAINNSLISFENLKEGDEVICLLNTKGIWIREHTYGYLMNISEILKF